MQVPAQLALCRTPGTNGNLHHAIHTTHAIHTNHTAAHAASHAIGSNALIEEEVATFLGDQLLTRYAPLIAARYGLPTEGIDGVSVIEGVAKRRGFRLKGGEFDLEKAAHTLLQDYRTGALGRISLETPTSRIALLASCTPPPKLGLQAESERED